jgi:16S rRNA (uracil1498-N3)-methyltransferase
MKRAVRAPLHDLAPGERTLDEATSRYLARVLRLSPGDAFVAFDPRAAREADAVIVSAARSVVVQLSTPRDAQTDGARDIMLVQGLAKGDKCDAVVRDATELGATAIAIARTERSVVVLEGARAKARVERWTRVAEEAARQSERNTAPRVSLTDLAGALGEAKRFDARFFLWESAKEPLGGLLSRALAARASIAFAVGPEGGFTEDEARLAEREGFALVSLGARILRTETVSAAVLGAVMVWGSAEEALG